MQNATERVNPNNPELNPILAEMISITQLREPKIFQVTLLNN